MVVGGPDVTLAVRIYMHAADFQVLGEAEVIIDDFIAAWERGDAARHVRGREFKADVTRTPVPRFELLTFNDYLHIGVQFSRGCPFNCEFCDIIELYGRVPRTKTPAQMLVELDALYALGFRGHVDFVDDNLIGNKIGAAGVPAASHRPGRRRTAFRSSSPPRPRSTSRTTTSCWR